MKHYGNITPENSIKALGIYKETLVALENQKKWFSPVTSADETPILIATDRAILAVTNAITRICTEGGQQS